MDDLVQWLNDQLDTDAQRATAAGGVDWLRAEHPGETVVIFDSKGEPVVYDEGWPSEAQAAHIAEHDPARVLREIDAKREIVRLHTSPHSVVDGFCVEEGGQCTHRGETECTICGGDGCATLRLLALPYADRPGYREEWRP